MLRIFSKEKYTSYSYKISMEFRGKKNSSVLEHTKNPIQIFFQVCSIQIFAAHFLTENLG